MTADKVEAAFRGLASATGILASGIQMDNLNSSRVVTAIVVAEQAAQMLRETLKDFVDADTRTINL